MRRLLGLILALAVASAFLSYGITTEVPMGRVYGRVVMEENGRPLKNTLVILTPANETKDDRPAKRYALTDETGRFNMANLPAGDYDIEASSKRHHLKEEIVTVVEGQPKLLNIEMAPIERYLQLYASQQVFPPSQKPSIEVHGFLEENKMSVTVRKLSLEAMARRDGIQTTLSALSRPEDNPSPVDPNDVSSVISRTTDDIKETDPEGAFVKPLPMPQLGQGFYWVVCEAGAVRSSVFLNISQIAMITKSDGKRSLGYVVDIETGKPIAGAKILTLRKGRLVPQATTDSRGLATVDLPASSANGHAVAAQYGGSTALCSVSLQSDTDESDDDAEYGRADGRIFTYTDRPVYRPGDLVRFKSIVRVLDGNEYKLPKPGEAQVEIRDSDQNLVQTMSAPLSSHGTLHGEFRTSPEAKPGVYQIVVRAAGILDHYYVNLAAYHKPDIKVTAKIEKDHYVLGDTVRVTVSAEYYFGGPVVGAKITGYVYRQPTWWYGSELEDEEDEDTPSEGIQDSDFQGGEYNENCEGVTDEAGRATIEFQTRAKDDPDSFATDYDYDVSLSVQDGPDRTTEASASTIVTRGDFNLTVNTDPMIASAGQTVDVVVSANAYDAAHSPVSGQAVSVQVGEERWTDKHSVFIPRQTLSGVTDAKGDAHMKLPVDREMSLTLRASAQDRGGRTVQSEGYLWVAGSAAEAGPNQPVFSVKLDKRRYKVGDLATAMIRTNDPGGVALLTLQADHVFAAKTVPLDSSTTMVHLDLPKEASPNAYVSVCYVHKQNYNEDSARLIVKREDRLLSVKVSPSAPTAQPGDTVQFKVHTANNLGRGVPAEVSVGVVDESVYAIKEDSTDIVKGLFPIRANSIDTEYSFPEVYLDGGDKGGGSIPIRTHFEDTASWNPVIETDADGDGTVSLKLPDNLTTWRATAVGVTDDSSAGMSTADIRASKPLMVRIQSPAFLVKTDSQSIPVSVTNDTGNDEDIHFQFDADGLTVDQAPPASLHLDKGETQSIGVQVTAPAAGPATLVAKVWTDDGAKDGVQSKFTVEPHGREEVTRQSGSVSTSGQFTIQREADADASAGRLAITLTPSVASGLYQSLDGLVQFPYGCVEQTLSRFLPAVMVTRFLKERGTDRPEFERRLPDITRDGFARLAAMQHEDGGWGWWDYDASDPFMTAWVLDGLSRLKSLGEPAPPTINLRKALAWASDYLENSLSHPPDERLYLMGALARYGRFHEDEVKLRILRECQRPHKRPVGDALRMWSMAAIAAHEAGETGAYAEILRNVQLGIDSPVKIDPWYDDFDDERTALALLALLDLAPTDPRIGGLATKLASNRGIDGWESTRATTFAVEALLAYIHESHEGSGPVDVQLLLNGQPLRDVHLAPSEIDGADLHIEVPLSQLQIGANQLSVQRTGPGTSFISTEIKQYRESAELGQVLNSSGISIERQYYALTPQTLEDGSMKLMKSKQPVDSIKTGETVECVLTIRTTNERRFLFIEDPIPSNCRVTQRIDPGDDETWSWWYCDLTIFDDKVGLFAMSMPKGVQTVEYTLQGQGPGVSHAMPTSVSNMYDPRQKGQGSETSLEVTP